MFNNSRDAYAIGAFKSGSSVNPRPRRMWMLWWTS